MTDTPTMKVSWYISCRDCVGYSVYTEEIARKIVSEHDVTKVEKVTTEWRGNWDDNTRYYTIISRETVYFANWDWSQS